MLPRSMIGDHWSFLFVDVASGSSVDWVYEKLNVSLAYTYEFRDKGNQNRRFSLFGYHLISFWAFFFRTAWFPFACQANHTEFIGGTRLACSIGEQS